MGFFEASPFCCGCYGRGSEPPPVFTPTKKGRLVEGS